ncbi:MAG TPA: CDP-diacylglycerol--serine O-phosphatidyltransferase [Burkholderiales bacterium]|nr:CDP-diacylglycerol--serine O-phosphatidyltransferase [Burkholderiales bacterium]
MADAPGREPAVEGGQAAGLQAAHPDSLRDLRRRGIYLLPNLFTTGVLFSGFFATVQAMNGHFDTACIAIYVAMVLDGMDGRVARWTNTQSEFGAQYDSIADMVAFGAAPALVAYTWVLKDLGTAGWIGAFIYCAGAGIRLARFNVNIGVVDKRYFQGMPSPSGAALLSGLIWTLTDFGLSPDKWYIIAGVTWLTAVFAGWTMVSNVPFYSFKEYNWRSRVPLWVILAAVLLLSVVASRPSLVLFVMILAYAISGYVMWAMGHRRARPVLPEE